MNSRYSGQHVRTPYTPQHARTRERHVVGSAAVVAATAAGVLLVPQLAASASSDPLAGATPVTVISTSSVSSVSTVSTSSSNGTLGQQILADAETRAGAPYVWGGNGPWAFDCSGLVVWAAKQEGVILPRTTYDMLGRGVAQGQLVRISADEAEPGDLAFFGPGHVEFVAGLSATFGAHHRNTVVSLRTYSQDYAPTMFFRVVG